MNKEPEMTIKKKLRNDITGDFNYTPEWFQAASDAFAAWLELNPPLESPEDITRMRASSADYAKTGVC